MNLEKNIDNLEIKDPKLYKAVQTFLDAQSSKRLVPVTITCINQIDIRKCISTSNRNDAEFLLFTALLSDSSQVIDIALADKDFKETRPSQHLQVRYDSQEGTITEAQALPVEGPPSVIGASAGVES